ncbi:unnamed protein product [Pylaiella littoralis]
MQGQARSAKNEWGTIDRKGVYGEGFMTIMKKSWPDIRTTPPHPRKAIDEHTLQQHRVCTEASAPRIRNACNNTGTLPEGCTADELYSRLMDKLADDVLDVGQSSDVPFDWDCSMYDTDAPGGADGSGSVQGSDPGVLGGDAGVGLGHESGAGAAGVAPTATEDARRARPRPSLTSVFNVEVGEFVALATPPAEKAAVSIGLVLAKKGSDDEGRELELR